MISSNDVDRIEGATAYGSDRDKIGKIDQLFLDDQTGAPTWVTINTGFFGTSQSFAPLEGAKWDGDDLRLGYPKDRVKDAPRIDADQHLDRAQEDELYRYYELSYGGPGTGTGTSTGTESGTAGLADSGMHTDTDLDDEAAVTLNEERLNAGTESREAGRARLRKFTTTETETVTVPVTKERLVVERTPVEGDRAHTGSAGTIDDGESVEEITLREERAVVDKETVPVEEVRVGKEQVTEQERVSAEVRQEHVDVDTDGDVDR